MKTNLKQFHDGGPYTEWMLEVSINKDYKQVCWLRCQNIRKTPRGLAHLYPNEVFLTKEKYDDTSRLYIIYEFLAPL